MIAYTDGSANPHDGGSGGWAFVLIDDQNTIEQNGGFRSGQTNNSMEMLAILECLRFVQKKYQDRNLHRFTFVYWVA